MITSFSTEDLFYTETIQKPTIIGEMVLNIAEKKHCSVEEALNYFNKKCERIMDRAAKECTPDETIIALIAL